MTPRYAKIEQIIRQRIADGTYTSRLPYRSELCREFEASDYAVKHALQVLKDDGLIFTRKSRGTFVTSGSPSVPPGKAHTVAEAAAILDVSPHTVYQHIHSGKLRTCHARGVLKIPGEALQEYIAHFWRRDSSGPVTSAYATVAVSSGSG